MRNKVLKGQELTEAIAYLKENAERKSEDFSLMELFEGLSDICSASDKPIVLMIDEVDSATNNQVFPDFLAQLRAYYIDRDVQQDKNQFIENGRLNMKRILEKFAVHFNDLYGSSKEQFIEEEGRKYFLLYLRPIINGSGNYYIEARTRSLGRTDVIVDFHGEQYVIEMKIWRGNEYNMRGEEQLTGYQDDYHKNKGYMVSFNFNKKKQIGVREIVVGKKTLIEAVV